MAVAEEEEKKPLRADRSCAPRDGGRRDHETMERTRRGDDSEQSSISSGLETVEL